MLDHDNWPRLSGLNRFITIYNHSDSFTIQGFFSQNIPPPKEKKKEKEKGGQVTPKGF